MGEVVAREEQWLAGVSRQRIGEAVTQVQASRVAAALAEVPVRRTRDPDDLVFTTDDVLARVAEHGDRFAPVATLQQELPAL